MSGIIIYNQPHIMSKILYVFAGLCSKTALCFKQDVKIDRTKMNVINIDWGVGVIQRGNQDIWDKESLEVCLTEEYFTSLVDNNSHNPLDSYNLSSNGQFLTDNSCVYSVDDNLTRTKLLPLITKDEFYKIYE